MTPAKRNAVIGAAMFVVVAMFVPGSNREKERTFECDNGGLVVIASANQRASDTVKKYCTGNLDDAEKALIKRYRSEVIPQWAFINVETLGE